MNENSKFKHIGVCNYKNIYDWLYLDFCITNNKNIKNKLSLMGKNGIGKTNFMYYFQQLSDFFRNSDNPYPENSKFDISLIVDNLEFDINGKFNEKDVKDKVLELDIKFTSAISNSSKNRIYHISSNYVKEMFDLDDDILNLKRQSLYYIILSLQQKPELTLEDMSFCKFFNLKYSAKTKKILQKIEEYSIEDFNNSYSVLVKDMLSKMTYLEWSDVPGAGDKNTPWDKNFDKLLNFLIKNKEIQQLIFSLVEELDVDLNNLRIVKDVTRDGYVVLFDNSQNKTLNFAYASVGTKKFFTLLTILQYINENHLSKLILIDEIDSGLNNYVIKSIVNNFWKDTQYVLSHHRPTLLTNNMDIFELDEICFFTYENGKKEIASLTEFPGWTKYKRNNKFVLDYLENLFSTEPLI